MSRVDVKSMYTFLRVMDCLIDTFLMEINRRVWHVFMTIAAGDDHPSRFLRIVASTVPFAVDHFRCNASTFPRQ